MRNSRARGHWAQRLRSLGLDLIIASGDRQATVQGIARALGIAEAHGRLDPQAKLALIRSVQQRGHNTGGIDLHHPP